MMASKKNTGSTTDARPPAGGLRPADLFGDLAAAQEPAPLLNDEHAAKLHEGPTGALARLLVEEGRHAGEEVLLGAGTCVIGRSSQCTLVLKRSSGISRRHALVQHEAGEFFLEDLESRNGTRLNGQPVRGRAPLRGGDIIGISDERIRFATDAALAGQAHETALLPGLAGAKTALASAPGEAEAVIPLDRRKAAPAARRPGPVTPAKPPPLKLSLEAPPPEAPRETTGDVGEGQQPPLPSDASPYVHHAPPSRSSGWFVLSGLLVFFLAVGATLGGDLAFNSGELTASIFTEEPEVEADAASPRASAPSLAPSGTALPAANAGAALVESPAEPLASTAAPAKTARPAPAPISIRAGASGVVERVRVGVGARVAKGDVLLVISGGNAALLRKRKALLREENSFARAAAGGNARARRDLEEVRAELRRVRAQIKGTPVRANGAGRVTALLVERGNAVQADSVVAKVAPE